MIASAINYLDATSLFEADFVSGKLFWKPRTTDMFASSKYTAERRCKAWNILHANKEAFTASNKDGYRHGTILGHKYKAHRVIWLLYTGEWPKAAIDHINGNPSDNRICNLRDVTQAENCKNQRIRRDNTSGVSGVSWHKQSGKWMVRVTTGGRDKHVGLFDSIEDAIEARQSSKMAYGFHPNHGRL